MKKTKITLGVILALVLIVLFGPRVDESYTVKNIEIPDNVEEYIKKAEAQYIDIRPNSEKIIIWNDPVKKEKTRFSVVYIHGYGASRQETAPLSEIIAKDLKANLYYTRLPAHAREVDNLKEISVNDYVNETIETIKIAEKLGDKVIVIGTSTGATLSTWLAAREESRNIAALVFISPNFWPKNKAANTALWPWGKQLVRMSLGEYRIWTPRTEEIRNNWNWKSPSSAAVVLMGLVDMVSKVDVSKIEIPLLMIYSPKDDVISPDEVERKYNLFGSRYKKLIPFLKSEDPSQHMLAGRIVSPSTTDSVAGMILDFLKPITK